MARYKQRNYMGNISSLEKKDIANSLRRAAGLSNFSSVGYSSAGEDGRDGKRTVIDSIKNTSAIRGRFARVDID